MAGGVTSGVICSSRNVEEHRRSICCRWRCACGVAEASERDKCFIYVRVINHCGQHMLKKMSNGYEYANECIN